MIGITRLIQALIVIAIYMYLFICIEKRYKINKFFLMTIILGIFTTNVLGLDSMTYKYMFVNMKYEKFEIFFRYSYSLFRKNGNFYLLNLFLGVFFFYFFNKVIILNKKSSKRIYFLLIGLFFINGLLNVTRASFAMCLFIYLLSIKKNILIFIPMLFHYSSIVLIIGNFFSKIRINRVFFIFILAIMFLIREEMAEMYIKIVNLVIDKDTTIYSKIYNYLFIKDKLEFYNNLHLIMRTILFSIEPIITFFVIWFGLKKQIYLKLTKLEKKILIINTIVFIIGINFIFLGKWIFGYRIIVMCSINNLFLIDKLLNNLFYIGILGLVINIFYLLYTMGIFIPGTLFYIL